MPACSSHSPHSDGDASAMPIASRTVAPNADSIASRVAGSPPPGSPATASTRRPRSRGSMSRSRHQSAR